MTLLVNSEINERAERWRERVQTIPASDEGTISSSEQVFRTIRETVVSSIPAKQQADILARLDALERAQNTPAFGVRYTEFIASAANHMT